MKGRPLNYPQGPGQKLLTLYGERYVGRDGESPDGYNYSVTRGYASMSDYIQHHFKDVTIHSVSFSSVIAPPMRDDPEGAYRAWIYATVLFSGELSDREQIYEKEYPSEYQGMGAEHVKRVHL